MVIVRPYRATHALLLTPDKRKALVVGDDCDTLEGSPGKVTWMRMNRGEREVLGTFEFDGIIEEITNDYQHSRRKRK